MTEQMSGDSSSFLRFYVVELGVRRELTRQIRGNELGYNCVTITNVSPELGADRIVPTQSAFEAMLVAMNLMDPDAPSRQLADGWPSTMDSALRGVNAVVGFFTGSRRLETWLPLLK